MAQKSNKIYLCFKNGLTASQAAICGVNRNMINRYYNLPREAGSMSWTSRTSTRDVGATGKTP